MAERRPNKPEVVRGSIPTPRTIFSSDRLGPPGCPYMERWVADFGVFSLRLHHGLHSDDMRAPHDHPWWFLLLCLWGRYVDVSESGHDVVSTGSVRFRRAEHRHSVRVTRSTWTLLVTGPEKRTWGFWVKGKFRKRNKYFYEYGHHDPVRPTERWNGNGKV